MSRHAPSLDLSPVLSAAHRWLEACLVGDGSMFTAESLWTPENLEALRTAFVEKPDTGADSFMTKLLRQTRHLSPQVKRLTAEVIWALLLFPRNIGAETKRQHIRALWESSKTPFPEDNEWLADGPMGGIGSGGTGYNNHRPRELTYLLTLACEFKKLAPAGRRRVVENYDAFMRFIDEVPQIGTRQFPHMLRYLAFPERVERMASRGERRSVLAGLKVATLAQTKGWTDKQLDDALLRVRQQYEAQHPARIVDFYDPPLVQLWKPPEEPEDLGPEDEDDDGAGDAPVTGPFTSAPAGPAQNIIYYGPPGTGKTWKITELRKLYVDKVSAEDQLERKVGKYGWRAVIAAAIANLGAPARVPQIREHRWVQAKARERKRTSSIQQTIWGYLLEHTPESNEFVKNAVRRAPFIFTRNKAGEWQLTPDWREQDDEAAALEKLLNTSGDASAPATSLSRMVTFHPSYGYEEFVRGIRPVSTGDGDGADTGSAFVVVDGAFKRICDEALASPHKRFAFFIDEINRANIAKVFGELITLIEPDKRLQVDDKGRVTGGLEVQLAGSKSADRADAPFGVPANLDIYGTMNTADRSIALLDIALRRRFQFVELEPDYGIIARNVGAVQLHHLLRRINDRLEFLLDRDHRIGHAYFMKVNSLTGLRDVFEKNVIPLLQEYFFDDLSRVASVLATSTKGSAFVQRDSQRYRDLFGMSAPDGMPHERDRYVVTRSETWEEEHFVALYSFGVGPVVAP